MSLFEKPQFNNMRSPGDFKPGDGYNPEAFIDPKGYVAALDKIEEDYLSRLKK